ncbi:MAG: hypothetical protein JWP81_160 [Ferruginibacter sp.]|nr:hypothetical protein [Ferruginibacter sp.]
MSNYTNVPEGKDPILWAIAKRRASFKNHAVTYVIVNLFLWAIWYFTSSQWISINHFNDNIHGMMIPWPIWTTLGWGVGLAFHFAGAYIFPTSNSAEMEYRKLTNKQ